MRDAAISFVTQVSHKDLLMYLIAIKSIYRFVRGGKIAVLDDGSLTSTDRILLMEHLPLARIFSFSEVPLAQTPKGGTWERLLLISTLVRDDFVIQVDSDSVTLRGVPEISHHLTENCSFTLLGAGSFPAIEPMLDACNRANRNSTRSMEPQGVSERALDRFPDCSKFKYVRGTSALAGFARGSFSAHEVEFFSRCMENICGPAKWHEWGSEQVTSNLIIANSPNACPLPHPNYTSYYPTNTLDYSRSSFIHFMGGHRFENGTYADFARTVIQQLRSGNQ
jgi:hypothetical protein